MTREQLQALLADMTLEEKIGQVLQLSGDFYASNTAVTGPCEELGIDERAVKLAGSVLSISGAKELRQIQENYLKTQPHQIPLLFMADIINGYRTVFPIPLAQGCTFDPKLVEECAYMAARESAAAGLHVTFSPMTDLVRDARWGRVMESTGEDPYLNGILAASAVKGYQGKDLSEKGRIAACVKHFAAYGAPMAGREYNHVELSEHSLREDYLPSYREAIHAGAAMVMTSFNTLDRIPSTGNKWLMQEVLRGEMGFDGVLISDWAAIRELFLYGAAEDESGAAAQAIEAGVDIDMMTSTYWNNLAKLTEDGIIKEEQIDAGVWRILELKNKLGLFDNPYKDADEAEESDYAVCKQHRDLARKAAEESFVLLQNKEQLLPLCESDEVVWVGPYVEERNILGSWSFFADTKDSVTIKEAAERRKAGQIYVQGCGILEPGVTAKGFRYDVHNSMTMQETEAGIQQAVEAARHAKKVVVAIGEHSFMSGEGTSRADITVPDTQLELLRRVHAVNDNIVVVLFCGRPLDIRFVTALAKSVLVVWMPGTEGGSAIVDMLYGKTVPSGKLSMSFPYAVGQVPLCYNALPVARPPVPQEDLRFVSHYMDIPNEPLFPFGYGLSYTTFSYGMPQLDCEVMHRDNNEELHACVTVQNTGNCAATETVQWYIRDMAGSVVRPVRELKGFQRIALQPGETCDVSFAITEEMLRFYKRDMTYGSESGKFELYVGGDSRADHKAVFTLI